MTIEKPVDIHAAVTEAFNAGDLEGLMALYEPEATMIGMDGSELSGTDAIRENWKALLSFGGQMTLTTRYAIEKGDIALLSNDYTVTVGDKRVENAGWFYANPTPAFAAIRNYVAFYAGKMDACLVDGERVRPQAGDFYGGWITAEIVGPFKGEPGTRGW